jgi:hypothetical protein
MTGRRFTLDGREEARTLIPVGDGWLVAGESRELDVSAGFQPTQSWLFRFGADRSLEFTEDSGIRREAMVPTLSMLPDDIEDVDASADRFGPQPVTRQLEASDVTLSIEREERF